MIQVWNNTGRLNNREDNNTLACMNQLKSSNFGVYWENFDFFYS